MANRNFWYATEQLTEQDTTSTTFANAATLTFTPNANTTTLIIATFQIASDSASFTSKRVFAKLRRTSGTAKDFNAPIPTQTNINEWTSCVAMAIETWGASPGSQTYAVQWANDSFTSFTGKIKNIRIVAIELGANDKSFAQYGTKTTTNSTTFVDSNGTITFTPPSTGDYLLLGCIDAGNSSTSSANSRAAHFALNVDGTIYSEGVFHSQGVNDTTWSWGFLKQVNLSNASHNFKIQYLAENAILNASVTNISMVALRLSDLPGYFYDEDQTRTTRTASTFGDKVTSTHTLAAQNYLVLANGIIDYSTTTKVGDIQLLDDASTSVNDTDRAINNTFTPDNVPLFSMYQKTMTAGSKTIKTQYKSNGTATAGMSSSAIAVLQLDATAGTSTNTSEDLRITGSNTSSTSEDLRTTGTATSNTSEDIRVTGKDTSSSSEDIRTTGTSTSNTAQDIRVTGSIPSSTTQDLRTTGTATSTSAEDIRITGQSTSNSSEDLRVTGKDTSSSAQDFRVTGYSTSSTNEDLRITGSNSSNSAEDFRMTGTATSNQPQDIRVTGQLQSNSAQDIRVTGKDTSSATEDVRITGKDSSSTTEDIRISGANGSSNATDVRLTGTATSSNSEDIRVTGTSTSNSSQDIRVIGTASSSQAQDIRVTGKDTSSAQEDIRITGKATSNQAEDLRITGTSTANSAEDLRITGASSSLTSEDLRITGKDTSSQSQDLRVTGKDASSSSEDVRIIGTDTSNKPADLRLTGSDSSSNTTVLKIQGSAQSTVDLYLKLTGSDIAEASVGLFITGSPLVVGENLYKRRSGLFDKSDANFTPGAGNLLDNDKPALSTKRGKLFGIR